MASIAPAEEPAPAAAMEPMHGGQPGHFGPQHMYEKLGLSATQKSSSDAVFAAKGPALKNLHEQIRTNMEKLHQISPDDPGYSATISQLAQANGSLTTQLISAEADMRAQVFAILTPAQRTQLKAMEAKMRDHMREEMKGEAGHWGHHGPPPGSSPRPAAPPQ